MAAPQFSKSGPSGSPKSASKGAEKVRRSFTLEQANREGRGVVVVYGRLVVGHHVKAAKRMLALAVLIQKLEAGQ